MNDMERSENRQKGAGAMRDAALVTLVGLLPARFRWLRGLRVLIAVALMLRARFQRQPQRPSDEEMSPPDNRTPHP
jgi:hypothetical protein